MKSSEFEIKDLKEKLDRRNTMCSRAFHDIRGYFGVIAGNIKLIEQISTEEEVRSIAESALGALDSLTYLVHDFSDLNKMDDQKLKPIFEKHYIEDIVSTSIAMFNPDLHECSIEENVDENLPLTILDFRLMSRVLRNLLISSANRISSGGLVKIKVFLHTPENSEEADKEIIISVSDSGPRISDKIMESPPLQFCNKVISLHRGRIEFNYKSASKERICSIFLPVHGN